MSIPVRTPVASAQVLLAGLIDYAGLFPPASLEMLSCVKKYSHYLNSPERWVLGRFVLPVARLDEFLNTQENAATDPWKLSGIVSANIVDDLAAVDEFNRKAPGAVIDTVELRVRDAEEIELAALHMPAGTAAFFEIAPEGAAELLTTVRRVKGYAKLRTGGVVKDAFPAIERIEEFLSACAQLGVAFKATAGLHHPLRCVRSLTYEANAQEGMMHGFLNLFTAASIAWESAHAGHAIRRGAIAACLADEERTNWHFDESGLTWTGDDEPLRIGVEGLRSMRSEFALSFGSCSFEEPLTELRELDLL
jgi:hypothetical protein